MSGSDEPAKGLEDLGWYERVIEHIAWRVPIAHSRTDPSVYFLANGGSVSIERSSDDPMRKGMLEAATPECMSPRDLSVYQAAQDRLMSECVEKAFGSQDVRLLKNSSDDKGHLYGQQENYEVEIASGWRLWGWRFGLMALLPLILSYKLISCVWLGMLFSLSYILQALQRWKDNGFRWTPRVDRNIEEDLASYRRAFQDANLRPGMRLRAWERGAYRTSDKIEGRWLSPKFLEIGSRGLRWMHQPIAIALLGLVRMVVLIPHRRHLAAFLASRCVLDGAGCIDDSGRYYLSAKASSVTRLIGFGRYWNDRPVLDVGHWLRAICADRWYSLRGWAGLFRKRQRLQIGLGDSTPNQVSEYLRIGATVLMIDMIESGITAGLPRLNQPMEAFIRWASDWMLISKMPDRQRVQWNSLDVQREYLQAARKFLQRHWQVPVEAWEIIQLWESTLENLRQSRHDPEARHWLLGRVDWLSKKWLMDQVALDASWSVRKKVDLRYHELSSEGYLYKLQDALQIHSSLDETLVERAIRNPPMGTPACKRGYLIREFSSADEYIRVDWELVELGEGRERRVVRLR